MTFDTRARRAAQGIHRAVEVMEMSSTKTPQRLTRFDQYRDRKSRNQRIAAIAVGIAVPLAMLGAVFFLKAGPDEQTAPMTQPSGSVSPTPVTGRPEGFNAPFTYTVSQDWADSGDGAGYAAWDATDGSGTHLIALSSVVAARSDCSVRPMRGVGTSSDAMTSWLSAHPALDATTPRPVSLGQATGSWVDVQVADDWDQTCRDGLALVTARPDERQNWSIYEGAKLRIYVLDLPSGDTVTIVINVPQAGDFQDVIDRAAPFVESFEFIK